MICMDVIWYSMTQNAMKSIDIANWHGDIWELSKVSWSFWGVIEGIREFQRQKSVASSVVKHRGGTHRTQLGTGTFRKGNEFGKVLGRDGKSSIDKAFLKDTGYQVTQ